MKLILMLAALAFSTQANAQGRLYGFPDACKFFAAGGGVADILSIVPEPSNRMLSLDDQGLSYPGTICVFASHHQVRCKTAETSGGNVSWHETVERIDVTKTAKAATLRFPDGTKLVIPACPD